MSQKKISRKRDEKWRKLAGGLQFAAVCLSLCTVPFYFLAMFFQQEQKKWITLIDLFQQASLLQGNTAYILRTHAVLFVVLLLLTVVAGVLSLVPTRVFRIIGTTMTAIAAISHTVQSILLCTAKDLHLVLAYAEVVILVLLVLSTVCNGLSIAFLCRARKQRAVQAIHAELQRPDCLGDHKICFVSGACKGYQIPVRNAEQVVIGKDPSLCSVVIDRRYTKISRVQCTIGYDYALEQFVVTDHSTNGTFMENGKRLTPEQPIALPSNALLSLARTDTIIRLI